MQNCSILMGKKSMKHGGCMESESVTHGDTSSSSIINN